VRDSITGLLHQRASAPAGFCTSLSPVLLNPSSTSAGHGFALACSHDSFHAPPKRKRASLTRLSSRLIDVISEKCARPNAECMFLNGQLACPAQGGEAHPLTPHAPPKNSNSQKRHTHARYTTISCMYVPERGTHSVDRKRRHCSRHMLSVVGRAAHAHQRNPC
jgi:hypothetical protein